MRSLAVLAAMAAAILSSAQSVCAQPTPALLPQPLPIERLFPLEAEQCGCFTFRRGTALHDGNVVFTATPAGGRIKLSGREHEVRHQERKRSGQHYTNIYGAGGLFISTKTAEVQFAQVCASYPEPPLHGSCYAGTMTVRTGGGSAPIPVVQLCGC